jgi:hypothetical protein
VFGEAIIAISRHKSIPNGAEGLQVAAFRGAGSNVTLILGRTNSQSIVWNNDPEAGVPGSSEGYDLHKVFYSRSLSSGRFGQASNMHCVL